jgi:hypothetical protein
MFPISPIPASVQVKKILVLKMNDIIGTEQYLMVMTNISSSFPFNTNMNGNEQ